MLAKKLKAILKDFGVIIICVAVMAYVLIHLTVNFTQEITVEPALSVTLEDTYVTDGYIMRYESPVYLNQSGLIVPYVAEGARVALGDTLFSIYDGENDAETESLIGDIDRKISVLRKSASETGNFITDRERIDEQINLSFTELLTHMAQNSVSRAENRTDDILVNMNKRWLITNGESSFEAKIAELEQQKTALQGELEGTPRRYYSKQSGYFSSNLDGYEEIFTTDDIEELEIEDFLEMTKSEPNIKVLNDASGKVITNFKWRVLCYMTREQSKDFVIGADYPVIFPFSYNTEITMTLETILKDSNRDDAVLVLSSKAMPDGFNYTRKQEIEIVKSRHTGLGVKKSAMRHVDGKKGVYILSGNRVEFRYAEELCQADDYYIIDATKYSYLDFEGNEKQPSNQRLKLYDRVIVEGKNIYEGKFVE